jgi:hypothetical protein
MDTLSKGPLTTAIVVEGFSFNHKLPALPYDIMHIIFKSLPYKTQVILPRVARHWRAVGKGDLLLEQMRLLDPSFDKQRLQQLLPNRSVNDLVNELYKASSGTVHCDTSRCRRIHLHDFQAVLSFRMGWNEDCGVYLVPRNDIDGWRVDLSMAAKYENATCNWMFESRNDDVVWKNGCWKWWEKESIKTRDWQIISGINQVLPLGLKAKIDLLVSWNVSVLTVLMPEVSAFAESNGFHTTSWGRITSKCDLAKKANNKRVLVVSNWPYTPDQIPSQIHCSFTQNGEFDLPTIFAGK